MLFVAFITGELQMKNYLEVCMAFSGHLWKVLACLASTNGQRVKISEVQIDSAACRRGQT